MDAAPPLVDPKLVVLRFNDAINRRDLEDLVDLMTDDHRFIDSAGASTEGRDACRAAWRGFFERFPDYRNDLELVCDRKGCVAAVGCSHCSAPALSGPAIWSARVRGELVQEWHVLDDSADTRRSLGLLAELELEDD